MRISAKKAATAKKAEPAPKKDVVAPLSRKDIQSQVDAFLKAGGAIQSIPNGVSGQPLFMPSRRHIVIAKKKV